MTELTFQISRALARSFAPGDEIVVTTMEHEGNVSPWLIAAPDFGPTVRWVAFDEESWRIEPAALAAAPSGRTRVVALNYASNMTGSINDDRAPTVSMTCAGRSRDSLAAGLARRGINGWSGHNYAFAGARQLGLDLADGVLRLGLAHNNTQREVAAALEALREECSAPGGG